MQQGFDRISSLATKRIPFLFIISYDKKELFVAPIDAIGAIQFSTPSRHTPPFSLAKPSHLHKKPISFDLYRQAFDQVIKMITQGHTYLLNLTFSTPIHMSLTLQEVYDSASAPYKLLWPDRFVCFSPEPFITIRGNTIATFPMKGTIDATLPNAKTLLLQNAKEMAEHVMVVDLLRNDLGMVGSHVRVQQFRYINRVATTQKQLLQTSSHIEATLPNDWRSRLGEILFTILPAGSITGTPKKRTCEIIESVESHRRGFFTGVFGYFDGYHLESAVMIRFIEKRHGDMVYKSGGGITIDSNPIQEYHEMIDKVYLPLH